MLVRALIVLLGLAAAGLTGFGLGYRISTRPTWREVFDETQQAAA